MAAYYNEHDKFAAAWLRELIKAGHIAPGDVDERSIEDVTPNELAGYDQCHFFAGIGGWSLALRYAGWPDDRPVWTGSCPCQPFSAAGKGAGFDDVRHLWPSFQWLLQQRRPPVVFGEQVASKATDPWIDLVHADLEAMGYAFGCVPFPSAGIGAPHIRDRAYWVADSRRQGLQIGISDGRIQHQAVGAHTGQGAVCGVTDGGVADSNNAERRPNSTGWHNCHGDDAGQEKGSSNPEGCGGAERMANTNSTGQQPGQLATTPSGHGNTTIADGGNGNTGPTNGQWRDVDWLFCRDGKWRPVEPGTQPLAHGVSNRVGRLRGYGNAINPWQAAEFIKAYQERYA